MRLGEQLTVLSEADTLPSEDQLEEVLPQLEQALGSPDPDLRDTALALLERHLEADLFAAWKLHNLAGRMVDNMQMGLGETGTDSVFLRAYSVLVLFEILSLHNRTPRLGLELFERIYTSGLAYFVAEQDLRAVVASKGWAHAVPHATNLLIELAKSAEADRKQLQEILSSLSIKTHAYEHTFLGFEDELFAYAVGAVLRRSLVSLQWLEDWLEALVVPPDAATWSEQIFRPNPRLALLTNLKAFLRALALQLRFAASQPQGSKNVLELVEASLKRLDTGFYTVPTPTQTA